MTEKGLYYPDGSYRDRQTIIDDLKKRNETVIFHTPLKETCKNFGWWHEMMTSRQLQRQEILARKDYVKIEIPTDENITLFFLGDIHAGGEDVDYDRFGSDIAYIRDRPNTYVIAMGDLIDAFFFNPAQHESLANLVEQNGYMQSALKEIKGKLLVGFGGDHDRWSEKMGETMYERFGQDVGAYYMEGVGYIDLIVGKQQYRIAGAHRHNGFSIYNNAHAAHRLYRDHAEGADILITAHNHVKATNEQTVKLFGGESKTVYYLSLGTYKFSDRYSRKKGFARQSYEEMGMSGVVLNPHERRIETIWEV